TGSRIPGESPSPALPSLRSGRSTSPRKRGEGRKQASAPGDWALAVLERTERLGCRDGGAQMIEVARILRLRRLLHLEQIRVVDLAAIGADGALAEQRVIGRHRLHLGDDRLAVRAAFQFGHG